MSRRDPPAWARGGVCVPNRSDRVWVFRYVRFMPLVMLVAGMGLLYYLVKGRALSGEAATPVFFGLLFFPVVFDRLPAFNPVHVLVLTDDLRVIRIAGRHRAHPAAQVTRVEMAVRGGGEYDDWQAAGATAVTIRLQGAWPARLLVTSDDARHLAEWGRRHGKPVVGPRT